jgi:pyridoxamine 5'-phosphate oxidase
MKYMMIPSNPFQLWSTWFEEAQVTEQAPLVGALATSNAQGYPSVRFMHFHAIDNQSFVFHTDMSSPKCADLKQNPRASVVWWWASVGKHIRVEGLASPVSQEKADALFQELPRRLQIMMTIFHQSDELPLNTDVAQLINTEIEKYGNSLMQRPNSCGGYRIHPERMEFFHVYETEAQKIVNDRFLYCKKNDTWQLTRLAP